MTDPIRPLVRRITEIDKRTKRASRSPQLPRSSMEGGALTVYQPGTGGLPGSIVGQQPDGSYGAVPVAGPTPPTPKGITLEPVLGGVRVRWDGTFEVVESTNPDVVTTPPFAASDWARAEVHISPSSALSGLLFTTLRGSIESPRGGDVVIPWAAGILLYVRLVARTQAGKVSAPSAVVGPVQAGQVGVSHLDPDVQQELEAASGANRVTFSVNAPGPDDDGTNAGDTWFQRDPADGDVLIGAWEWNGADWQPRTFGDQVLGSVTVSKLVSGVLQAGVRATIGDPDGARIDIGGSAIEQVDADGNITFQLTPGGSAFFAGILTGRSANYEEGSRGWLIGADGDAAFQGLQVFEDLTAKDASVTSLTVAGRPLADIIDARANAAVAQGFLQIPAIENIADGWQGIAEITWIAQPGRAYTIFCDGPKWAASNDTTAPEWIFRYTNDGSTPTYQSPDAFWGNEEGYNTLGNQYPGRRFRHFGLWYPPLVNNAPTRIRLLLTVRRSRGLGTIGVYTDSLNRLQMWVQDSGQQLPNSIVANLSRQASPPPPPPAAAPIYREARYDATWGAAFLGSGAKRESGGDLYQGRTPYYTAGGNHTSMIGFDLARIRSELAGASIRWARFYILNRHTHYNAGGTVVLGSHGSAGEPASWGAGGVQPGRSFTKVAKGGWAEIDVTGIVTEIRNSQAAGLTLGGIPDTNVEYYGYYAGVNGGTGRPHFIVGYDK